MIKMPMDALAAQIEELMTTYAPLIKRVIKKTSPDISAPDLEEIEQEVKLAVWKQLAGTETEIDNLASYIWKVTFNATCYIMGKRMKQKTVSIDEIEPGGLYGAREPETEFPHNEEAKYDREKLNLLIKKSVDQLGESRRQVLKLYLLGMSKLEIAGFLNWSEPKVRNLLYRGMKDLGKILKHYGIDSYLNGVER